MASAYLKLAEQVLSEARKPLTPAAIMQAGYQLGLVPWHLHGKTQQKTLHARLSEEIASSRERSRFYRTAPGTFFLASFRTDPDLLSAHPDVHLAPPRRKDLRKGLALCLSRKRVSEIAQTSGRIDIADIEKMLDAGEYSYRPKIFAFGEEADDIPIASFVVVHVGLNVLSFRTGKYVRLDEDTPTKRSIGFGDVVSDEDRDLLYNSFWGVRENAIQDLMYGIGLEQSAARAARYTKTIPVRLAYKASLVFPCINVVMSYEYVSEEDIQGRSLAFNDLRWITPTQRINDLSEYDETSQAIISNGWISECVG